MRAIFPVLVGLTLVGACDGDDGSNFPNPDGQTSDAFVDPTCNAAVDCAKAPCDLATATSPATICPRKQTTQQSINDCNNLVIVVVGAVNGQTKYYYDKSTGQLKAVFDYTPNGVFCTMGPKGFTQPTCTWQMTTVVCPEGGVDAAKE